MEWNDEKRLELSLRGLQSNASNETTNKQGYCTSRELNASLADICGISIWKIDDKVMGIGQAGCSNGIVSGGERRAVCDIFRDAALE